MTPEELAKSIDHTLLKPTATLQEVKKFCEEAVKYNFAAAFVSPSYVGFASRLLKGTTVKVGTPIGFPLGISTVASKRFEAAEAVLRGAREIDMVINLGAVKSGDFEAVKSEVEAVVNSIRAEEISEGAGDIIVKVIIETCYLTDEEKIAVCKAIGNTGIDFVKTSTGFGPSGATVSDVELLRSVLPPDVGVKASGGIRTLDEALKMLDAGATRIGTSSGVEIMKEFLSRKKVRKEARA